MLPNKKVEESYRYHDDLQAEAHRRAARSAPDYQWEVEKKLGEGYADVVGICLDHAVIIEVKTKREDWCAGSVIRQLRGYSDQLLASHKHISQVQLFLFSEECGESARYLLEEVCGIEWIEA